MTRTVVGRAVPLVVGIGIVYYGLLAGEYGWLDLYEMRVERDRIVELTDSLTAERAARAAAAERLARDPDAIERVARERYGMIREGETLLRFVPLTEPENGFAGS